MRTRMARNALFVSSWTVCSLLLLSLVSTALAAPLDNWNVRTLKTTNKLYNVDWDGTQFIAVGETGTIVTSGDGVAEWSVQRSGTSAWLWGITHGNGVRVATGQDGTILTSLNGTAWSPATSQTTVMLRGAAFGNGMFVVVGDAGTILTSTDNGGGWVQATSGVTVPLYGVTYGTVGGTGLFVVVGQDGTVLTSPDGATWTAQTNASGSLLHQVAYGNGLFVATSANGETVAAVFLTSTDGVTWTQVSPGVTCDFYSIAYGKGTFVAVGTNGNIYSSTDGAVWAKKGTEPTTETLRGVVYGDKAGVLSFVATGSNSPDGVTVGSVIQSDPFAPVAKITADKTNVEAGQKVTLNGEGSSDPEGLAITTYAWEITEKPAGSAPTFDGSTTTKPELTPDKVGTYIVSLIVTNSAGTKSAASTVTIKAGVVPIAEAGPDVTGAKVGTAVVLDGTKSSAPDGNTPLDYTWSPSKCPSNSTCAVLTDGADNAHKHFTGDVRGIFTISLSVANSLGLQCLTPDTMTVTVGNHPIANPGSDQNVNTGDLVRLDGSSSYSPDGSFRLTYSWSFSSRPAGSIPSLLPSSTSPQPSFIADRTGTYKLSLVVTDPAGLESQKQEVEISAVDVEGTSAGIASGDGSDSTSGSGGASGCFIATAAFGSPYTAEVTALRRFRDLHLLTNPLGRCFVRAYYRYSPPLARLIERHESLKATVRMALRPAVYATLHPLFSAIVFCGFLFVLTTGCCVARKLRCA